LLRVLQLGAAPIASDVPVPSVDDLADQVADVLDFFRYCIVTVVLMHDFFMLQFLSKNYSFNNHMRLILVALRSV